MQTKFKQNPRKRLLVWALLILLLLSIPLIAMQFTKEVDWNFGDFFVMGILLTLLFTGIEIVLRIAKNAKHRMLLIALGILLFLLTWAELAVGIFNSPLAGN